MATVRTLGLRVKSGIAVVTVIEGDASSWRPVHVGQVALTAPVGQYARFPYHPLIEMDSERGPAVSREAVATVHSESRRELARALKSIAPDGGAGVVAGSAIDPNQIANPHIRAHAREGRLFQEVVIAALERAEIPYRVLSHKTARTALAAVIGMPERELWDSISRAGQGAVRPWRIDQKLAAVGALYALCTCAGKSPDRTAATNPTA
jgi:hypothetical protein